MLYVNNMNMSNFGLFNSNYSEGNIQKDAGLKRRPCDKFCICYWNLNSIPTQSVIKISLLRVYISAHNVDIPCLLETDLDSSFSNNDNNETISRYNLYRADNPSNVKHGGCIYYKSFLPFNVIDIQYLQQFINFEMKIGGKLCKFIIL